MENFADMKMDLVYTGDQSFIEAEYAKFWDVTNFGRLTTTNLGRKYYVPWNFFKHLPFVAKFDDESAGSLTNYIGVECAFECDEYQPPEMLVELCRQELRTIPTIGWNSSILDDFRFDDVYEENLFIHSYKIITKMAWEGPDVDGKQSILSIFRGQHGGEFDDTYAVLEFGDFSLCAGVQKGASIFNCSYFNWGAEDAEKDEFDWVHNFDMRPDEVLRFIKWHCDQLPNFDPFE